MADDDLKLDVSALEKRFTEALRVCPEDLFAELKPRGHDFLRQWINVRIRGERFARGAGTLRRRTGTFSRAFDQAATGNDLESLHFAAGTIRQGLKYAWIQEYGGEIRPKRAKYLTIPLEAAMTPAGVLKKPAREWPDTFVRMRRGGQSGTIFQKTASGPVALFALVKRVRIIGRLGFFDSWKKNEPLFVRHLAGAVDAALKRWAARGDIKGGA